MFRFTIRELLLVTLGVELLAGWWLDRHELAASLRFYRNTTLVQRAYKEKLDRDIEDVQEQLKRHGLTLTWRSACVGQAIINVPRSEKADQ